MSDPEIAVLSIAGLARPTDPPEGGTPPQLRWIEIDALYVDRRYQREIGRRSRANIARIAAGFDWAFFAPVIVAPLEGGDFYCIIDGQHRASAAKLIGKTSVPCSVVTASRVKQAAAFGAINGMVTAIQPMQLHASAVAAGDPRALEVQSVAAEGGARILRNPTALKRQQPNDLMAVAGLARLIERHGRETAVRTLLCVTSGPRPYRGLLRPPMLFALAPHVEAGPRAAALARIAAINLAAAEEEARRGAIWLTISEAIGRRLAARERQTA